MTKLLIILLPLFLFKRESTIPPVVISNLRTPQHVAMPNIKLSIIPPTNYVPLPNDNGFYKRGGDPAKGDEQIKASKFFLDFQTVKASLLLDAQGSSTTEIQINNYEGIEIKTSKTENSITFTSLTLAFGNSTYSYVVVGVSPSSDPTIEGILKKSIETAFVDTFGYPSAKFKIKQSGKSPPANFTRKLSPLESLAKIDVTGTGFKLAEIINDDLIVYSLDAAYPPVATDKSIVQLKRVSATVSQGSYMDYSKQLLNTYTEFTDASNVVQTNYTVNGLNGIETICDAHSTNPTANAQIYQVTLFDGNNVFVILGISFLKDSDMLNKFKMIAKTFSKTAK
jgi:hypothetical protein